MAELGGMIASAILKVVSDQIGSLIVGQITLQQNFNKDLTEMKTTLEMVEAVLKDAEWRSIKEEVVRLWLKELKNAMYEISDMIDEFEVDAQAITQPSAGKFSLKKHLAFINKIVARFTLANRMKTTSENLKEITRRHTDFRFLVGTTNANEPEGTDERETCSTIDTKIIGRTEERDIILSSLSDSMTKDTQIIGRTEERDIILSSLSDSETTKLTVLPIYGIGGLGKTTLAKLVFDSSRFKEYSRVWVYVSQTFDLKKIGNSIISQLWKKKKESQCKILEKITNTLRGLLADKKILIVLDDLWEDKIDRLDELKAMLKVGEGSKVDVIVTTRDEDIANKISTTKTHKLAELTADMCWSIIKEKSNFESRDDKKQLEQIGKDIASKCGGVAIAAHSLGHVLRSTITDDWKLVRDSDIWSMSASAVASLRLSYRVMSSDLKLCFAYCAIFPKGYKIFKSDLIHQWVSLGFLGTKDVHSSWQLGEKCIRQLLGLSFLQDSKSQLTAGVHLQDATSFTMHDLVHDLARSVMDDGILVPGNHDCSNSCCRYALLNDCSKPLESSRIRALRFLDCREIELRDDAFSSAKSRFHLRVLDLSECSIHKLPDSIGQLKQLRYLNAPGIQDGMIPVSITRLSKLIYLNLSGSSAIKALPASIGELEGLVYLDLSGCYEIEHLPESLGKLNKLVHLDLSGCSGIEHLPESLGKLYKLVHLDLSGCSGIKHLPASLKRLNKLVHLDLSKNDRFKVVTHILRSLTELQYLNLSYCPSIRSVPGALGGLSKLQYLNLSNSKYENVEVLGTFTKLKYLNLSNCQNHDFGNLEKVIGNLTKLEYLNLSGSSSAVSFAMSEPFANDKFDSFICRISTLSNLEHLDLSNNNMHRIPGSLCKLTKLHTLDLSSCRLLEEIPESIGKIDSLKFIYVNACIQLSKVPQLRGSAITLPRFMVHAGDGEPGSNLFMLKDRNPDKLEISRLENVKSAEEAQIIKLVEKKSLEKLKLVWSGDAERFVDDKVLLEKLVPPSTLKILEIGGYNGVSFPAWLTDQLPTKLDCLELSNMEHLEEWNTSYSRSEEEHMVKNLKIRDCPKLRMKTLPPRAKRLWILNSDKVLSSFGECASSSSPIVTSTLKVERCNVPLHQWSLLHHLPGLTELKIERCGDLTVSRGIIDSLNSLKELTLIFTGQQDLPEWLGKLSSLRELKIINCREIKELHDNMRQLTQLQALRLSWCCSLASLPHWLGELTSLKRLVISDCEGIRSLPEGIQQLANLQELRIRFCPELEKWCESEENKMKLAHIKEKEYMPSLCDFEEWIDTEMTEKDKEFVAFRKECDEEDKKKCEKLKTDRLRREERLERQRAPEAEQKAKHEAEKKRKREKVSRAKEADPEAIRKKKWPRYIQ